jgi:chaperonin GroEL
VAKQLLFEDHARARMLQGVEKLAKAVAVTMGPTGRNVIFDKSFGGPTVTKDGVTVAKEIELEDRFENMGSKLVVEVAQKTSDLAGDGTTTATVLARAIFREGLRNIVAGSNPMAIRRGIERAVDAAVGHLHSLAKPVTSKEEVAQVGAISANNDMVIGRQLADALERVGKDGVITVEEGKKSETEVEFVDGMQFDKGYISPYFINRTSDMDCVMEDCFLLLHEKKISSIRDLIPILEKTGQTGKPLLIICRGRGRGSPDAAGGQQTAGRAERVRRQGAGLRRPPQGHAGRHRDPDRWHVDQRRPGDAVGEHRTVAPGPCQESHGRQGQHDDRRRRRRAGSGRETHPPDQPADRADGQRIRQREVPRAAGQAVRRRCGGLGRCGHRSGDEAEEGPHRGRLHATRAAVEEGILPGGGVALLRCREAVEKARNSARGDEKIGVDIVLRALDAPLKQIVDNCGLDGSVVAEEVREKAVNIGYDANSGQYVDMFKAGIIDPVKVVRTALANAASIAGLLLTTETLVTKFEKEDKEKRRVEGSVA